MVLAAGVPRCRFCRADLTEFWAERGVVRAQRSSESALSPVPKRPSDSRLSPIPLPKRASRSGLSPIPRRTAESDVSPFFPTSDSSPSLPPQRPGSGTSPIPTEGSAARIPKALAPPPDLVQVSRVAKLPVEEPKATVSPGSTVASAALEAELNRVARGDSGTLRREKSAEPHRATSTRSSVSGAARAPVEFEAFDTRRVGLIATLVLVAGVSALLWGLSSGTRATGPAQNCTESCQVAYDAAEKDGTLTHEHVDYMSACISQCLKPQPEGAAESP